MKRSWSMFLRWSAGPLLPKPLSMYFRARLPLLCSYVFFTPRLTPLNLPIYLSRLSIISSPSLLTCNAGTQADMRLH